MDTAVSLLDRLRDGTDQAAWRRLDGLYRPLIRRWLRTVTHHRVLAFRQKRRERAAGDDGGPLAQLADPNSELSRLWDQEHDQHVLRRLLELLEFDPPFEGATIRAFRLVFFEERKPAEVAATLGLTPNAVLLAKSRVLKWLRQESGDLLA